MSINKHLGRKKKRSTLEDKNKFFSPVNTLEMFLSVSNMTSLDTRTLVIWNAAGTSPIFCWKYGKSVNMRAVNFGIKETAFSDQQSWHVRYAWSATLSSSNPSSICFVFEDFSRRKPVLFFVFFSSWFVLTTISSEPPLLTIGWRCIRRDLEERDRGVTDSRNSNRDSNPELPKTDVQIYRPRQPVKYKRTCSIMHQSQKRNINGRLRLYLINLKYIQTRLIPVTARSKAWFCGRSPTGIPGSNPTGGHGCLSVVSVVCCHVKLSGSGWSLVQRRPTECGVSECNREASIMWRPWTTGGSRAVSEK